MNPGRLRVIVAASFVLGAAVLLLADATWLRLASVLVLLGCVVAAVFLIATPEFLAADAEDDRRAP